MLSTLAPHLQAITLPQGLPARDPQRRWAQAFGGTERLAYLGAERNRAPAARGLDRNRLLMRLRLRWRLSFLAGGRKGHSLQGHYDDESDYASHISLPV